MCASRDSTTPGEPNIWSLSQEVHDLICEAASSTRELKALRATCKEIYKKTEDVFIKRSFAELEINLDERSLQYAISVANSKYSDSVYALSIRPRYYNPWNGVRWAEAIADHRLRALLIAQGDFVRNRRDVELLAKALSGFEKLQRIDVEASSMLSVLDRDASGLWARTNHVNVAGDGVSRKANSHAFSVLLEAMGITTTTIRELRAGTLPKGNVRKSIDHMSLELPTNNVQALEYGLARLEELSLVCEVQGGTRGVSCENHLLKFLERTRNVKKLHLSFWHFDTNWLCEVLPKAWLRCLGTLHLEAARKVDVEELRTFVQTHAETLRSLTLVNIGFRNDELAEVFPSVFAVKNIKLNEVKLQQLCSFRTGMLVFDELGIQLVCETCREDMIAAWKFQNGPACPHATLVAKGSEVETTHELSRLQMACLLPWPITRESMSLEADEEEFGHGLTTQSATPTTEIAAVSNEADEAEGNDGA